MSKPFPKSFGLFFKMSPAANPFFIHKQMKANFHMKRWAPGLALKKRPTVIQFTLNQLTVKAGLSGPTCSQYVYCNMLAQSTGRT